jgi:hypothetical protein
MRNCRVVKIGDASVLVLQARARQCTTCLRHPPTVSLPPKPLAGEHRKLNTMSTVILHPRVDSRYYYLQHDGCRD